MSKDKKRLVPVRRFKEFENAPAWEQRKLSKLTTEIGTGKSKYKLQDNGRYPILGSTSVIGYDNNFDYTGDFILTARVGANAGNLYRFAGSVKITDNTVFIKSKYNKFLYYYLQKYDLKKLSFGTGQPLVKASELKNLKILKPRLDEEIYRISKLLLSVDNLITLHQRKLDKLKRVKSAYLTEMFPAEGEREPKRRFPGFTVAWEQRKLGEVVEITMGQSPSSKNYTENPNDHILVQGNADMKNGYVVPRVWTTQITKQAEKGDLILSVRAPVGDIGKTDYDVVLGRGVAAIKGNSFIFQLLTKMKINGYWTRFSTGSTFESINSDNIKNAQISIPSLREQEKIGGLFNEFDSLIALHQRKLDKLKKMKAAYLEEMFV